MDTFLEGLSPVRLNIGLGRGFEFLLLEASEMVDKST
jgi:hypothetical protein